MLFLKFLLLIMALFTKTSTFDHETKLSFNQHLQGLDNVTGRHTKFKLTSLQNQTKIQCCDSLVVKNSFSLSPKRKIYHNQRKRREISKSKTAKRHDAPIKYFLDVPRKVNEIQEVLEAKANSAIPNQFCTCLIF